MKESLKSALDFYAQNLSKTVFIKNSKSISAKEFLKNINSLANHFDTKLKSKNIIALCIDDIYLFCCSWIACQYLGKTTLMLPNNKSGTIANLAEQYDILVTEDDLKLSTETTKNYTIKGCETIFFTSGSTGNYKSCTKTINNIEEESYSINKAIENFKLKEANVYTTVSHQHLYGFSWALIWPLLYKKIIHTERLFIPEVIHKKLCQDNSILVTTPVIISHLEGNINKPITNSLIISAASELPTNVAIQFQNDYNIPILETYGSSETGVIAYRQPPSNSLWQAFNNVDISTDSNQLIVKSPFFNQEKLLMPDIVEMHNDKFKLKGRADKIVKIAGNRLSLSQMQNILLKHELIQDCACIKRQSYREYIAVLICLNQKGNDFLKEFNKQKLINKIKTYLLNYYPNTTIPKQWRFVAAIPTNSQGKRTQELLIEVLEDGPK
ncbi:AMP-binding protein [Francisella uliginis]|uniref:Aconitate hydratase n=1 Tax=Francisella uliginis TaxID=573570 RepID=A0A1L4BUC1_9GAMM|nr:AMP-binding protein [Francisella uliginis]API87442.1 aconitate hydratase [Francisella uliginis]